MQEDRTKKTIFLSAAVFAFVFMIVAIFFYQSVAKDCGFVLAVIIAFYFIEKKYPLLIPVIICGLFPMILDPIGVTFGFFNFYPFGIGYDKLIHFGFNLLGTIVIFHILKNITKKHILATVIVAVLVVNGIGNIGKLLEFTGSKYIGYYSSSMFSEADGNPPPNAIQDFIIYDPWWDLLFGFFGTITAGSILLVIYGRNHVEESSQPAL